MSIIALRYQIRVKWRLLQYFSPGWIDWHFLYKLFLFPPHSVTLLFCRHIFGVQSHNRDLLRYVEEETVVFVCGHNIVIYQPDSKTQKIIPASAEGKGISAIAVCIQKKLLAIAEQGDRASISVLDLQSHKRRKILTIPELACQVHPAIRKRKLHINRGYLFILYVYVLQEYVSISFSSDGKLLAAQTGAPHWTLAVWSWEKSKLVATTKVTSSPGQCAVQCQFSTGNYPYSVYVRQHLQTSFYRLRIKMQV